LFTEAHPLWVRRKMIATTNANVFNFIGFILEKVRANSQIRFGWLRNWMTPEYACDSNHIIYFYFRIHWYQRSLKWFGAHFPYERREKLFNPEQ
jgi:hypothetical protein